MSALSFVLVMVATAWGGRKQEDAPAIEYAEALDPPTRRTIWDRFGLWTVLAVILVLVAYAYPLWQLISMERFGSPGFKPF